VIVEAAMIPVASPARQHNFVAGVQITLAEQFGVEGRGGSERLPPRRDETRRDEEPGHGCRSRSLSLESDLP
jgi:hypothetical protein